MAGKASCNHPVCAVTLLSSRRPLYPACCRVCVTVQVLDLGSCRSLWRLPASLLDLSELTRLVLTSKAVAQDIVERLELRPLNPVEVEFAADDDWDGLQDLYFDDEFGTMDGYD